MSEGVGGIGSMCSKRNGDEMIIDAEEEDDLGLYPVDDVDFSEDTEWFFEGAWLSMLQLIDHTFPSVDIGDPMCGEDEDGDLGIWVRLDCGSSALWLRVMTFSSFHWGWSDEEYH